MKNWFWIPRSLNRHSPNMHRHCALFPFYSFQFAERRRKTEEEKVEKCTSPSLSLSLSLMLRLRSLSNMHTLQGLSLSCSRGCSPWNWTIPTLIMSDVIYHGPAFCFDTLHCNNIIFRIGCESTLQLCKNPIPPLNIEYHVCECDHQYCEPLFSQNVDTKISWAVTVPPFLNSCQHATRIPPCGRKQAWRQQFLYRQSAVCACTSHGVMFEWVSRASFESAHSLRIFWLPILGTFSQR